MTISTHTNRQVFRRINKARPVPLFVPHQIDAASWDVLDVKQRALKGLSLTSQGAARDYISELNASACKALALSSSILTMKEEF